MAKIEEIIKVIEDLAPLSTQESWDNSGWQVRLSKKDIKKAMLCVSVTNEVLKECIDKNCDMIIAHHPLFFGSEITSSQREISDEMIRLHLPLYSIHTPFDKAKNGTTDMLLKACGFSVDDEINEYTKISYCEISVDELISKLKSGLGIDKLRVTKYSPEKIVSKIAFCAGSGTGFCDDVQNTGCDCFISADLKYHTALEFDGVIIDVGHLEGEKPALLTLKEGLKDLAECVIAEEKSPIEII